MLYIAIELVSGHDESHGPAKTAFNGQMTHAPSLGKDTMKALLVKYVLVFALLTVSPSFAGAGDNKASTQSSDANGTWNEFKADWRKIGNGFKASGVQMGRALKKEFQEMPGNFRKGYKAAKKDFKALTGSPKGEAQAAKK